MEEYNPVLYFEEDPTSVAYLQAYGYRIKDLIKSSPDRKKLPCELNHIERETLLEYNPNAKLYKNCWKDILQFFLKQDFSKHYTLQETLARLQDRKAWPLTDEFQPRNPEYNIVYTIHDGEELVYIGITSLEKFTKRLDGLIKKWNVKKPLVAWVPHPNPPRIAQTLKRELHPKYNRHSS